MKINIANRLTTEIFIFVYNGNLYEATLDYTKHIFKIKDERRVLILYWRNISRMELDKIKNEIKKNIMVLRKLR